MQSLRAAINHRAKRRFKVVKHSVLLVEYKGEAYFGAEVRVADLSDGKLELGDAHSRLHLMTREGPAGHELIGSGNLLLDLYAIGGRLTAHPDAASTFVVDIFYLELHLSCFVRRSDGLAAHNKLSFARAVPTEAHLERLRLGSHDHSERRLCGTKIIRLPSSIVIDDFKHQLLLLLEEVG